AIHHVCQTLGMKVFCAWLPMLVVALREKNEAELADLAEPEPAVCCVKDNPLRAAAALRASAEVAFLDLVNTGAYAFGTGLTGHLLTHCRALGVPDATCPKNVEVSSARAARAPEMLSDAAQRLQSFARSTVYWAHTPDPSKPDCGSARAGYVAGDASRCQQEVGSFGLLAQLWGAKLVNDVEWYHWTHDALGNPKIHTSQGAKEISRLVAESNRLLREARRLWAD
ncbi:unnamed protein product, partial [Effrenium voratum]